VDIGNFTVDVCGIITDPMSIMPLTSHPPKEQTKNDIRTVDPLVDRILRLSAAYGRACGLPRVTVSWRLFGDSKKLDQLHAGKDLVTRRAEAALAWFAAHWPQGAEPAAGAIEPESQEGPEHPLCARRTTESDVPAAPAQPPRRPGFRFSSVGWNGSERSRWEREISGPPKGESRADLVLRRFSWQDAPSARDPSSARGRLRLAHGIEVLSTEPVAIDGPEPSTRTRLAHRRPDAAISGERA
jgi:hypothetical protein